MKPLIGIRFYLGFLCLAFDNLAFGEGVVKSLTGHEIGEIALLKEHGYSLGGWLSTGVTYNTANPKDNNNFPVTFNDRTSELQLNQFNLYLQKSVDLDSKSWDFGGRFDFMFGTDPRFTQATGLDNKLMGAGGPRFYDIAFPQVYLEVFAPIGKGISAKIGHFYTILGQEVVMSPNNFFYSHAYTMQYGEPFTHTGVVFNYSLNENFSLNVGSVAGWDNFRENFTNWNFLGSVSWADDDATNAVSWSVISGDVNEVASKNRTLSALVVSHSFTDKLQYVFQNDFGFQQQATVLGKNAFWYGINQYLIYSITDMVSVGLRAEWFRDADGIRVVKGNTGDFFELTAGINWKLQEWLTFRPEIRYDWVGAQTAVFDNKTRKNQLGFSIDMVVEF